MKKILISIFCLFYTIIHTMAQNPDQASNVTLSNQTETSVTISWTIGAGDRRLVMISATETGTDDVPALVDGTAYTASSDLSQAINYNNWFCVYDDGGDNVTVTGLIPGVEYRAMVCEYFFGVPDPYYVTYMSGTGVNNPLNFNSPLDETVECNVEQNISIDYEPLAGDDYYDEAWATQAVTLLPGFHASGHNFTAGIYAEIPVCAPVLKISNFHRHFVELNWTDTETEETGFLIYRSSDGVNFSSIGTTAEDQVYHTDNTLGAGRTYFYKVAAMFDGEEIGPWSNIVSVTTFQCAEISAIPDKDKNYTHAITYDDEGCVIGESAAFFDLLGKPVQSQSRNFTDEKVMVNQTLYDAMGRGVLTTLPAPVNQEKLGFVEGFITNIYEDDYSYDDFDNPNSENPGYGELDNPGKVSDNCHLGAYYRESYNPDQDIEELYVPSAGGFPYARVEYSTIQPGVARRASGPGEHFRMGATHPGTGEIAQAVSFSMPASDDELATYLYPFEDLDTDKLIKTVSVDIDGKTAVSYSNTDGNIISACLSGTNIKTTMSYFLNENQYYYDIHVPFQQGIVITYSGLEVTMEIHNLLTEKTVTTGGDYNCITNGDIEQCTQEIFLEKGFYRVSFSGEFANAYFQLQLDYHSFSANIYDEAGRLKESYSPKAVSEIIMNPDWEQTDVATTYSYNSLGWLMWTKSPDEGLTEYKYQKDGKIRFSRNAQQEEDEKFSYTNYDKSGRILEVGECDEVGSGLQFNLLTSEVIEKTYKPGEYGISGVSDMYAPGHYDQTFTIYDIPDNTLSALVPELSTYTQHFVAGKVSKTWNEVNTTWYSYTYDGKTEWVVQKTSEPYRDFHYKVTLQEYTYDFVGNVTDVKFEDFDVDYPFNFTHKYQYDQDNRLDKVYTIDKDGNRKKQADYSYYQHGPLKRAEIADNLQGIDYVYTIQGWLKSINNASVEVTVAESSETLVLDPGRDGFEGGNEGFSKDLFGMSLDYFNGDYKRNGTLINYSEETSGSYLNGNIRRMRWRTAGLDNAEGLQNAEQFCYNFMYDDKNQLTTANFGIYHPGYYQNHSSQYYKLPTYTSLAGKMHVNIPEYDLNGNIKALTRYDNAGQLMDDLDYNYKLKTNQLENLTDGAPTTGDLGDIMGVHNYFYNEIGQLIEDQRFAYEYNVYGKVSHVETVGIVPLTEQKDVEYFYDDRGFRSHKLDNIEKTVGWYIRDLSGNIIGYYEEPNMMYGPQPPILKEVPVYGASRLGMARVAPGDYSINKYEYELSDHLGNVRATFSEDEDNKGKAKLDNYTDYYPFGWEVPNRIQSGNSYRFAYQGQFAEKDEETGFTQFEARLFDSRIGRWMSPDPAGQYYSPYLGMGNSPIIGIDPDGRFDTQIGAYLWKTFNGGGEVFRNEDGDWGVVQGGQNGVDIQMGGTGWRTSQFIKENLNSEHLKDYAIGFQRTVGVDANAGVGAEFAGLVNHVLFFDEEFGGYWYDFAGGEAGATFGIPSLSAQYERSWFIAKRRDGGRYGPYGFEGDYGYDELEFGLREWGAVGVLGQLSRGKEWDVFEFGVSVGADVINLPVSGSYSFGSGYAKCLNTIKPTRLRTWSDIGLNHLTHFYLHNIP